MYYLTSLERRILLHLFAKLNYDDDISTSSLLSFLADHLTKISRLPISSDYQIMIDRITPILIAYQKNLALKSRDIGIVSSIVTEFDVKFNTLHIFLDALEATTRNTVTDDEITLKFLCFTNRKIFKKGSETAKLVTLNSWLKRIATVVGTQEVLAKATTWVEELSTLQSGKQRQKGNVTSGGFTIKKIRENIFAALRMNFGDLYRIHAKDIRGLLKCFNPKLLSPVVKKPGRLLKNESILDIENGKLTSAINNLIKPSSIIVIDNRNNPEGVIFLTKTFGQTIPDYALKIPENAIVKTETTIIGVSKVNIVNVGFTDPEAKGKMKITIRKRRKRKS